MCDCDFDFSTANTEHMCWTDYRFRITQLYTKIPITVDPIIADGSFTKKKKETNWTKRPDRIQHQHPFIVRLMQITCLKTQTFRTKKSTIIRLLCIIIRVLLWIFVISNKRKRKKNCRCSFENNNWHKRVCLVSHVRLPFLKRINLSVYFCADLHRTTKLIISPRILSIRRDDLVSKVFFFKFIWSQSQTLIPVIMISTK